MKIKKICALFFTILLCTLLCVSESGEMAAYVWNKADRNIVVIDPGHGGIDGGAEGCSGTNEKDINLAIAQKLKTLLEKEGVRVIMTRETDEGLYEQGQDAAIRTLKTQDMHERKRIIDEAGADLAVSIHLNSFTQDASVRGAQVFFPSEGPADLVEKSEEAAAMIQAGLNEKVNTDKKRTELGKNDVYLFRDISCPIVIAECGFLSSPEDAEALKNAEHQAKIAEVLCISICDYVEKNSL